MFKRFSSVLDECLVALSRGDTVEQCLARYPRQARRLRPVLTLATRVQASPRVAPRVQAQEQSWRLVRERAHQLRTGSRRAATRTVVSAYGGLLKPAAVMLGAVLLVGSFSGGLAYASQDAMPDSPLYSVKLAGEDVRLWFVFDDTREAEILLDQSNQRVEEIRGMVSQGKTIPSNVLSDLHDRNERASDILAEKPQETGLRARILTQAQQQEDLLVALWPQVSDGARGTYTETVAFLHNTQLGGGSGAAVSAVRPEDLLGGILNISGQVQQLENGNWSIGGVEVNVDDRTIGNAALEAGASARFVVARSSNGRLQALSLIGGLLGSPDSGGSSAIVSGAIESITDEGITVGGTLYAFSSSTVRTQSFKTGQKVQITVQAGNAGNSPIVQSVKPAAVSGPSSAQVQAFTFEGTIEGDVSRSTNEWMIGGLEFQIADSTAVDATAGDAKDGARAQVEAINDGGDLQATRVSVLATDAPANEVSIIGKFEGFEDGVWIVAGLPIVPPDSIDDPELDALVSVETERVGNDLNATSLVVVETAEQEGLIRMQGTIKAIDGTRWTLEFGQVRVSSTAEVIGSEAGVGQRALMWSEPGVDGQLQAVYVRVLDDQSILTSIIGNVTPTPEP